ncbi:hypothetical protein ACN28E_37365 [Archangium lansingense]|uniref:hypothetical protein n=1 Tax=Archangium lansingense TaxID=2995310 RepID=UPI003B7C2C9D
MDKMRASRTPRRLKPVLEMQLGACPIPRPGDEVTYYSKGKCHQGTLLGHDPHGRPKVMNKFGNPVILPNFSAVRLLDPNAGRGPNWTAIHPEFIKSPHPNELELFEKALETRIPPGRTYKDLAREVAARGFELYLVGGTVRDVLAGRPANDMDFATTMPLVMAVPLLNEMFGERFKPKWETGYTRIGGSPESGDPFIDLKVFAYADLGTSDAIFGCDFMRDIAYRDFACNSVYYDPLNQALIDPSRRGIEDAEQQMLQLVCDERCLGDVQAAKILIRFFKFLAKGFTATPDTNARIRNLFLGCLRSMKRAERCRYVKTQLLSKYPRSEHDAILSRFREQMIRFGAEDEWRTLLEPFRSEILK